MSESDRPRENVSFHVPRGTWWGWVGAAIGTTFALICFLIRLAFSLEGDLIREQERVGAFEARFKQLEDRRASCESSIDTLRTRVTILESSIRR